MAPTIAVVMLSVIISLVGVVTGQILSNPSIWPLPQQFTDGSSTLELKADRFQFVILNPPSSLRTVRNPIVDVVARNIDILREAFKRYFGLVFNNHSATFPAVVQTPVPELSLTELTVSVNDWNADLRLYVSERYELTVSLSSTATLTCDTVFGCLRGLESFSQLIIMFDGDGIPRFMVVNVPLSVVDAPRFPHRGLLIDSSRHFLPIHLIKQTIDGMSYDKLNVLHWHLVDFQSFPVVIEAYSKLAGNGAYTPRDRYTKADLKEIGTHLASCNRSPRAFF